MHFAFFPPSYVQEAIMCMSKCFRFSSFFSTFFMCFIYLAKAFLHFIKRMLFPWDELEGLLVVQRSLLPSKTFKELGFMSANLRKICISFLKQCSRSLSSSLIWQKSVSNLHHMVKEGLWCKMYYHLCE